MGDPLDAYRVVGDPAALRARGVFVVEGRTVVRRLLEDGRFVVESVLATPAASRALGTVLERSGASVIVRDQATVNAITGIDFHRGCLALACRPASNAPLATMRDARRLLVLEGVGNPDNVGGVFRAALALGGEGVVLDATSADPFYRKAIRTSMGASLRLPFTRVPSLADAAAPLRSWGFRIVALTPAPDAIDLALVPRGGRVALLLGNEGAGLTAAAQAQADVRARIPIAAAADSLNLVVAAGIALYALR